MVAEQALTVRLGILLAGVPTMLLTVSGLVKIVVCAVSVTVYKIVPRNVSASIWNKGSYGIKSGYPLPASCLIVSRISMTAWRVDTLLEIARSTVIWLITVSTVENKWSAVTLLAA